MHNINHLIKRIIYLLFLIVLTQFITVHSYAQDEDLKIKMKPYKKGCIYYADDESGFKVVIKNMHSKPQSGSIELNVINKITGEQFVDVKYNLSLGSRGSFRKHLSFGVNKFPPGFYTASLIINTDSYEDTLNSVFGVSPDKITYELHRPKDFDQFWDLTLRKLAEIEPEYDVVLDESLTTKYHKVYRIQMTSWENVRIEGYLTVPNLPGKFPVTVNFAGYLGFVSPVFYEDFAALSMNIRGIGKLARQALPANAEFNTYNIRDRDKYIYRGVFMDCVRSVDFVLSHPELGLDTKRIVVYGGSQGGTEAIITAALCKKVNSAAANNPVFADFRSIFESGMKEKELVFPMVQFDKFFKQTRTSQAQALKTLDYYDLSNFMERLECPILIGIGLKDPISPPQTVVEAFNHLKPAIKEQSKIYYYPNLTHEVSDLHWLRNFNWLDDKLKTAHN